MNRSVVEAVVVLQRRARSFELMDIQAGCKAKDLGVIEIRGGAGGGRGTGGTGMRSRLDLELADAADRQRCRTGAAA